METQLTLRLFINILSLAAILPMAILFVVILLTPKKMINSKKLRRFLSSFIALTAVDVYAFIMIIIATLLYLISH